MGFDMTPEREEFKEKIRLACTKINMWSMSAEDLLFETALHESMGLKYRKQVNGPALSFFQIEPDTLKDLYDNWLKYRDDKKQLLDQFRDHEISLEENLRNNDEFAIVAARLQYYRKPGSIPEDLEGRAAYWKEHWNTKHGAGTIDKYINDYKEYS